MHKRHGWFIKSVLSYVLLASVLLVGAGTLIIGNIRAMISAQVMENTGSALRSVCTIFENFCRGMEEYALQIKRDAQMSPYVLQNDDYAVLRAVEELRKTAAYSNLYDTIALVYHPNKFDSVPRIYSSFAETTAQTFFSYFYRYDQWDLQNLYDEMDDYTRLVLRAPEWVTQKRVQRDRYLTGIAPLNAGTTANPRGVMLFLIAEDRFVSLLRSVNIPQDATLVLADDEGRALLSSGSLSLAADVTLPEQSGGAEAVSFSANGEQCRLWQADTGREGWRLALMMPEAAIEGAIQGPMNAILFILGLSMLAAVSASFGLSTFFFRPVKRLTNIVSSMQHEPDSQANEFEQIEMTIAGLSKTNADLSTRLHSQSSSMRQHILRSMCLGNMEQKGRFLALCAEDGIAFDETRLRVVALMIDNEERLKAYMDSAMCVITRYSLLKVLRETVNVCLVSCVGCEIGVDNSIVAVLSGNVQMENTLRAAMEQLQHVAVDHFDFTLTVGVSKIFDGLDNTGAAYRQATRAAERRFLDGCGQIFFAEQTPAETPMEEARPQLMRLEARLMGALREEKYGEAVRMLDGYVQALRELRLSPALTRHQFLMLRSSIDQQLHLLGVNADAIEWMNAQQCETLEQLRDAVAEALLRQEKERKRPADSQHSELVDRCVDYMQEHIADDSLTVDSLAEAMGISAGYLSRTFKAQMSVSPWQYFDGLRMRQACALLRGTELRIQDILSACGYVDKTNFMRKFKAQYGMTPMEYRQANSTAAYQEQKEIAPDDES